MIPSHMAAVLLTGQGDLDMLSYRTDVPVPTPRRDEVLIRVAAAGINNTDIITRTGWYSRTAVVTSDSAHDVRAPAQSTEASGWAGTPLRFPRIQGADVCGYITAVGANIAPSRIGERVLVRTMLRTYVDYRPYECWTLGSECDGGFAQFTVAPARETYAVNCEWSDVELASIPCSYSTAENMLERANVGSERVLITGASGGVGIAAVQLARRRGATVIAQVSESKAKAVLELGANRTVHRGADLLDELGEDSIDVIIDLVAGDQWPVLLDVLRRGGRYACAGAIAGPVATIDVRKLYLKDLTLLGCTFQQDRVFTNLVDYIEAGEIRPVVARSYPLADIAPAQRDFVDKNHVGKLVLVPPDATA